MQIATLEVPHAREKCWRVFTSPAQWLAWVPGLVSAHVVERDDAKLPRVVRCEYAGGVSYTLHYSYDLVVHSIRWRPEKDDRGGVRGFVRFETVDTMSTRVIYANEHDQTRTAFEAELDDPQSLLEAFARSLADIR